MISYIQFKAIKITVISIAILFSGFSIIKIIEDRFPNQFNGTNPTNATVVPSTTTNTGQNSGLILLPSPIRQLSDVSVYLLPITWGIVVGVVLWNNKVKAVWKKNGYDYDLFRLVTKMRGSPLRLKLLDSLKLPKNKLQISKEFGVDWKTIDNHINLLLENSLIEEMTIVGTSTYYIISEKGKRVLILLSDGQSNEQNARS